MAACLLIGFQYQYAGGVTTKFTFLFTKIIKFQRKRYNRSSEPNPHPSCNIDFLILKNFFDIVSFIEPNIEILSLEIYQCILCTDHT